MHAISSGLDTEHTLRVQRVWSSLQSACGLNAIYRTPVPHFSWQISQEYDFEALEPIIEQIAAGFPRFTVRTTGLGVFTGEEEIVLYLALVKDETLFRLQAKIWHAALPFAWGVSEHYAPENWVPHITLGHADIDPENLACAVRLLARKHLRWTVAIDHLAVLYQDLEKPAWEKCRFPFDG